MTRVGTGTRLAYSLPACALAAVGIPLYIHLPKFYTDVVGVNVATMGFLLVALRGVDAITDPMVGMLSDRTRSRFGRRRPFIATAALPLVVSIYFLFTPPIDGALPPALWCAVWLFAMYLCWTAVAVPYESLAPELTYDYDERTALVSVREALLIVGTLAGAVVPGVLGVTAAGSGDAAVERAAFEQLALLYAPLILAACWACVAATREPAPVGDAARSSVAALVERYRETLANRPFAILLAAYTVSAIGGALPATLIFYYVEYVLGSDQGNLFLAIYFVVGFIFLPGWVGLARRIGKKPAWLTAIAVNTGAFIGVFFLGPGQTVAYGVLVAISGVGFGATLAIPSSMQADVIDYDELLSGTRREGQYIGLWSIARKAAGALGVGVALPLLDWVGYVPNVPQTPSVVLTLRALYAGVPCVCSIASFFIALRYPIDRMRHAAIRDAIARRAGGASVVDPLVPGRMIGAVA